MKSAIFLYIGLIMLLFILAWAVCEVAKHQKDRLTNTKPKGKAYHLTLQNGEKRIAFILHYPKFRCMVAGDGSYQYLTMSDILLIKAKGNLISCNNDNPQHLWVTGVGYLQDEGTMFDVYKSLRNPIIKLKLILK